MSGTSTIHLTLDLLDRQLLDRRGVLCGNVDDVEIEIDERGEAVVVALCTGAGALATRLGRRRLGAWLLRADERLHHHGVQGGIIPMSLVRSIGPAIELDVDAEDLPTHDGEAWMLEHVIGHLPGRDARASE